MASVILKPIATISVEHQYTVPEGVERIAENAYLSISEEGDTNILTHVLSDMTNVTDWFTLTSRFKIGGDVLDNIKTVKLIANETIGTSDSSIEATHTVTINGVSKSYNESRNGQNGENGTIEMDISETASYLNNYIKTNGRLPDIEYKLITRAKSINADSKGGVEAMTFLLDYAHVELSDVGTDIGVYKKVDGSWVVATKAFQKQNGAWVELTEEECKNILQNI